VSKILIIGGTARSLINFRGDLMSELVKKDHKLTVCSAPASLGEKEHLKKIGVRCLDFPISRAGLNPIFDIKTLFYLWRIFKIEKPDQIMAYTIKPIIFSGIVSQVLRKSSFFAIITGLGSGLQIKNIRTRVLSLIIKKLYRLALHSSAGIFFQNPDDELFFKNEILSNKANTFLVHGSGVNLDRFFFKPIPEDLSFLMASRLLKDKGVYEYFEAARKIKAVYPNIRFFLAGALDENPMSISKEDLDKILKEGVIEYLGWMDDIKPSIINSKVFVLPSYHEGTPRGVLEAMSMGRPIITTDVPGCRETVLNGENGYLIKVRSVDSLVKSMKKFIDNHELALRMGNKSREIAEDKYDVKKVNAAIIKVLDQM
jgi:glycosyltransferase involved in cell wall biosynthesis